MLQFLGHYLVAQMEQIVQMLFMQLIVLNQYPGEPETRLWCEY